MDYEVWEQSVPKSITDDALWNVNRLALFLSDVSWPDITQLANDERTNKVASQLDRAIGSIGGNIAEGYCRGSSKDKARLYEYALGSARESRHWYYEGRRVLGEPALGDRFVVITDIVRLLLTMIPDQRGYVVREESAEYLTD